MSSCGDPFLLTPPNQPDGCGPHLALGCARNAAARLDRRSPEALELLRWYAQCGASLGIAETALPDEDSIPHRAGVRGVPAALWRGMAMRLRNAEARLQPITETPTSRWLGALGRASGLAQGDLDLLALAIHYRLDNRVERLFDQLAHARGRLTTFRREPPLLALLLAQTPDEVDQRLRPEAALPQSGLLRVDSDGDLFALGALVDQVAAGRRPGTDVFEQLLGPAAAPALGWEAFGHLGQAAEDAARVLRAALTEAEPGIHLILYGPPGTGKTSFAATLAARAGARLRPVGETDDHGNAPSAAERLAALRLGQRLSTPGDTVLLFDEAEDLFPRHHGLFESGSPASTVYLHRLLETTRTPVIWTANAIERLGPAVLRRMTMCLELRVPGLDARAGLWRTMAEAESVSMTPAEARRLAALVPAAPAVARQSLRAARLAGEGAAFALRVVEATARAVGGGRRPPPQTHDGVTPDARLLSADVDLDRVAASLAASANLAGASFLLSGPPGTGKSAWARLLAARLGLPVLQKRASDLLDCWLGGTEKAIADAFAEARDQNAMLVFDEADSLLLDRAGAVRSWEVTGVNEMLTWMEAHPLPFVCTTNLADRLDPASLRRFLVKVRFGWLSAAQARLAFAHFFDRAAPTALDRLETLTPADFVLVARRRGLEGIADEAGLVVALARESLGRGAGRVVGFVGSK